MMNLFIYSALVFFPVYYLVWLAMLMNGEFINKSDAKISSIPLFLLIRFFFRAFVTLKHYNEINGKGKK